MPSSLENLAAQKPADAKQSHRGPMERRAGGRKVENLKGNRYGRLLVVAFNGIGKTREAVWLCHCDCGAIRLIPGSRLRKGHSTSCGCFARENMGNIKRTHGKSRKPVYNCWRAILQRCLNAECRAFPNYGGRGIKVCARWMRFENFLSDMGEPPKGQSIERIDNDGNYEPKNCRWASLVEQGSNKRTSRIVTLDGITATASSHARRLGIPTSTMLYRLNHL